MTEVDRSPCRTCGADVEIRAELVPGTLGTTRPAYRAARTCTSLLCPTNLAGQTPESATA